MYFLPSVTSEGKLLFLGPKAQKNVNKQSSCRELVLTQLPNGLFSQTPGWLLISSNPISSTFQQGRERERSREGGQLWLFNPLVVIITSHIYEAFWPQWSELLLRTSLLVGRKDLRFLSQIRKGLLNQTDLASPRSVQTINFIRGQRAALEKKWTERMRQCAVPPWLGPLNGASFFFSKIDRNSSTDNTPMFKYTLKMWVMCRLL